MRLTGRFARQEVIDGDLFSLPVDVGAIVTQEPTGPGLPSTNVAAETIGPDTHAPQMIWVVPPDFRTVSTADGARQLADAYRNALIMADRLELKSVAFPLLSGGSHRGGMSPRRLWEIAEETLRSTPTRVEVVYLVRFVPAGREVSQLEGARERQQLGIGPDRESADEEALKRHRQTYSAAVARLAEQTRELARRLREMDQAAAGSS